MKKYLALGRVALQNAIAYRAALLISMSGGLFFVIALFYIWRTIYAGRPTLQGYSWEELKLYLLIAFATNTLLSWHSESRMSWRILDGSVMMDLLKPLDFQRARLAETLGMSVFEGGVSLVLVAGVLLAFQTLLLPPDAVTGGLFFISMAGSLLIKFCIIYLASLVCFWTTSGIGVIRVRMAITSILSGAVVPLAFFPEPLKSIALALPFQGIVHTPASIYLGRVEAGAALALIATQFVWVALLWLLARLMWSWAVRKVTIHGG